MPTAKSKTPPERPGNVSAIAYMNLASGALNILVGGAATVAAVLQTFFLGLICIPFTAVPVLLGVFEVVYGLRLLAKPPAPVKPARGIAILQIACFLYLNVVAGVVGILSLILYTDPEVQAYFEAINSGS